MVDQNDNYDKGKGKEENGGSNVRKNNNNSGGKMRNNGYGDISGSGDNYVDIHICI